MKLWPPVVALLVSASFATFGAGVPRAQASVVTATASKTKSASSDRQVAVIRQQVAAINNGLAKMSKTTLDVEGVSLEGTSATYYRSGKLVRKITATVYGETYQDTIDLYYSNGRLIFVLDRHSSYEAGLGSAVDQVIEYRVYFLTGKPAKVLEGSKPASEEVRAELESSMTDVSISLLEEVA